MATDKKDTAEKNSVGRNVLTYTGWELGSEILHFYIADESIRSIFEEFASNHPDDAQRMIDDSYQTLHELYGSSNSPGSGRMVYYHSGIDYVLDKYLASHPEEARNIIDERSKKYSGIKKLLSPLQRFTNPLEHRKHKVALRNMKGK